jgi:hypothetical protein
LDSQRTGNGYGPNALGFQAIADWCRLRSIRLLQWQLDAILEMDIARRSVLAEAAPESEPAAPTISKQPLTAKAMSYLFPGARKCFNKDGTPSEPG